LSRGVVNLLFDSIEGQVADDKSKHANDERCEIGTEIGLGLASSFGLIGIREANSQVVAPPDLRILPSLNLSQDFKPSKNFGGQFW
jgi:hypothetical protein